MVGGRSARHSIYKGRVSRKGAKALSQARVIIIDQRARNEARQEVEKTHTRQRDAQGTLRGKARCKTYAKTCRLAPARDFAWEKKTKKKGGPFLHLIS